MSSFTHRLIKGKYYPRITYMLGSVMAKGKYFENWLKSNGHNSDRIAMEAAESGTKVHKACELLQTKGKINPSAHDLNEKEYKKVMGFVNWAKDMKVKFKDAEIVVNDTQCCGRYDALCEIDGQLYIVDYKSGAGIYQSHHFQCSFYAKAWNEDQPGLAKPAILHLKDSTKKGYQFIEVDYNVGVKGYEACYELYKLMGFPLEPKREIKLPREIKLNI